MTDNITITEGLGANVKTDNVGGNHYQQVKLVDGAAEGTAAIGGDADYGLDVDVTRLPGTVESDITDIEASLDSVISGSEMQVDIVGALPTGTNTIGSVKITDGSETASVNTNSRLEVSIAQDDVGIGGGTQYTEGATDSTLTGTIQMAEGPSDTVTPLQVDASKHLQVDIAADSVGIGGGTEYTEGDTDATITGKAILWEDGSDTLRTVSAAKPMPVELTDNSNTVVSDIGDIKTSVELLDNAVDGNYLNTNMNIAGTDVVGGAGAVAAGVQRVTLASDDPAVALLATIDADTSTLAGAVAAGQMQVDVVAALPAGTNAIGKLAANTGVDIGDVDILSVIPGVGATNLGKAKNSAVGATDTGVATLGRLRFTPSYTTDDDGDYDTLDLTAYHELRTRDQRGLDLANCNDYTVFTTLGNDTDNLADSVNHVFGTGSVSFDKVDGAANTVYAGVQDTITSINIQEVFESGGFVGVGAYIPSLTDVVSVFLRIGTDSSNYNEWEWAVDDLTAAQWLALRQPTNKPTGYAGNGWSTAAITYVAFGVEFSSESDTLVGMVFDNVHLVGGRVTDTTTDATISSSVSTPNINLLKVGGAVVDRDSGNASTGSQRVVIATDDINLASMNTDLGTIAGAVTGTEMQVDVVAALPAGTNVVGKVRLVTATGDEVTEDTDNSMNVTIVADDVGIGGGTSYTEDVATANPIVGTATMIERDDQLSGVTPAEGDWLSLRGTDQGALWVAIADASGDPITAFGGGTEYTEDVATANPQVGKAIMVERDDALSAVTPIEGDWIGLRGTAEGALWTQDFNSDAILADTAAMVVDLAAIEALAITIDADTGAMVTDLAAIEVLLGTIDADTGAIKTAVELLDNAVDGSYLNTNMNIAGTDVVGGAGAVAAGVQRVTLASDDPAVALLATIDADTSTLAGAVAAGQMQVDVVASLPAGTNAIGKLAANSGVDIGDVDILSIAAGTNVIGKVRLVTATGDEVTEDTDNSINTTIVADDVGLATSALQLADGHNVTVDNIITNEVFVRGGGTAGSPQAGEVLAVQGIAGMTALAVTESSPISGFATSALQLADGHNVTVDNAGGVEVVQDTAADLNVTEASASAIKTAVELIDGAIVGPGEPTIDSYTQFAINLNAGANQVLVSSAASKQIWVYGFGFTVSVAGTVSFQDEDDTAISGIMDFAANSGMSQAPSGNFSMPIWKLATNKDLEVDVVDAALDGWISYAIVSV